jgi:uncharacterized protein
MGYALVTGASKGIGSAVAKELASRKHDVLLVARSGPLLMEKAAEIRKEFMVKADYLAIDLSLPGAAQELYDWCRKNDYSIDILVNNAGYGLSGPFEKYTLDEHLAMMQVNMNTLVSLCYLFLQDLKKRKAAYILNIASTTAYQAVPGLALYAATKSFVLSFSRTLSYELRKTTVSVTCVSPGSTDTDFVNRANMSDKTKKVADKFNMTPGSVSAIAVDAMFKKTTEVVPGGFNKVGKFLVWLLPKKFVEKKIAVIYDMH